MLLLTNEILVESSSFLHEEFLWFFETEMHYYIMHKVIKY
jgi:hypothetical protein